MAHLDRGKYLTKASAGTSLFLDMPGLDKKTLAEIKSLSVPERLEAVNILWESIPENDKSNSPVSESEKRILDFSIEHSEKFPEDKTSWEDLKSELHAKINSAR